MLKGEYHLPYLTFQDLNFSNKDKIKMCIARCARVSYDNHDGSFNQVKDSFCICTKCSLNTSHSSFITKLYNKTLRSDNYYDCCKNCNFEELLLFK